MSVLSSIQDSVKTDPINIVELGIPGLRHCMIRNNLNQSFLEMSAIAPYNNSQDRKR